jgi:hypothetical protein
MPTRLTNDIRRTITDSVLSNTTLFAERDEIVKKLKTKMTKWVRDQQPKEFNALVAGKPKEWFCTMNYVRWWDGCNPINMMMACSDGAKCWADHVELDEVIPVTSAFQRDHNGFEKTFAAEIKAANAWCEKYEKTRDDLRGLLAGFQTVEKLKETVPELERHIPKVENRQLPMVQASNVLSQLTKVGFDAGMPAAAEA